MILKIASAIGIPKMVIGTAFLGFLVLGEFLGGMPWGNPIFSGVVGWFCAQFFSAIVTGMPEPHENSSDWYVWAYRSGHLFAAAGTSYFAEKSKWHMLKGERDRRGNEKDRKDV